MVKRNRPLGSYRPKLLKVHGEKIKKDIKESWACYYDRIRELETKLNIPMKERNFY